MLFFPLCFDEHITHRRNYRPLFIRHKGFIDTRDLHIANTHAHTYTETKVMHIAEMNWKKKNNGKNWVWIESERERENMSGIVPSQSINAEQIDYSIWMPILREHWIKCFDIQYTCTSSARGMYRKRISERMGKMTGKSKSSRAKLLSLHCFSSFNWTLDYLPLSFSLFSPFPLLSKFCLALLIWHGS